MLELVRRRRLQERYSLLWLATGGCLFLLAAWSSLLTASPTPSDQDAANALFVVAAGFFLVVLLHFSLAMSRLSEQCSRLAQRLALLEERTAVSGPQPGPPAEVTPDDD